MKLLVLKTIIAYLLILLASAGIGAILCMIYMFIVENSPSIWYTIFAVAGSVIALVFVFGGAVKAWTRK